MIAQLTAINGRKIPSEAYSDGLETFYHHLHQLHDTGNNGNEKNKTQEAEVNTFNDSVGSQHLGFAINSSPEA